MPFNPDRAKQAQEVMFLRKTNKIVHLPLTLIMQLLNSHIHRSPLAFSWIAKSHSTKSHSTNIIVCKFFIRPHLDDDDVVYDQPFIASFSKKIDSEQYSAALAITEAIKGSSRDNLHQQLALEYLQHRR